eukprot:74215_1
MSALKLVQFRFGCSKLNDDMFKRLTNKFIDEYGRDLIEKQMLKCCQMDSEPKLNSILSELIKEQNMNTDLVLSKTFNIHTLSTELIQLTASYLPFNDYINFRDLNRKIFISLNQKCFLTVEHSLNISNIHNYPENIINLNNFPNLTSIELNLKIFNDCITNQLVPS